MWIVIPGLDSSMLMVSLHVAFCPSKDDIRARVHFDNFEDEKSQQLTAV